MVRLPRGLLDALARTRPVTGTPPCAGLPRPGSAGGGGSGPAGWAGYGVRAILSSVPFSTAFLL